jgi:hypothetical protein
MSTSNDEMGRAPTGGRIVELLLGILLTGGGIVSAQAQQQIAVPRIEQMPNFPQPYALRDWNKTARDFDRFAFDPNRKGDHGPWFWWDKRRVNLPGRDSFAISAYVGMYASNERTMAFDTITCLGAVLGGTLAGINKSSQNGYDWVSMVRNYFSRANEQNLYLNNVPGSTGQTFWYELFPSLLFVEIYSRYPNTPGMDNELLLTADRWREACIGLGARSTPWTLPNFECTAYDFSTGKAVDNGRWKEPDAAAGVAFVEYMAYARTGERKYIDAARWAMGFLDARTGNPFYEVILPFGVYTAARMNAELGYGHDTDKFLNWVLNGDNPRQWGVSVGRWGNHDCSGLLSSIIENEGYAFPMNTFNAVGVIAPMARYDDRYARAIGKWVLNAANASRFFYPDALPDDLQADPAWSRKNDPDNCVAYEGMRENGRRRDRVIGESAPLRGEVQSGSFKDTIYQDQKRQTLIETRPLSTSPLEHIWQLRVSGGRSHALVVVARTGAEGQTFRFSCATNSEGPWTSVFSIDSPREKARWWGLEGSLLAGPKSHPLFLRVESAHPTNTTASVPWSISVDDIYVETVLDKSPYAMGDPTYLGWGATDYGLYGSCFAGMFGALIAPTSVEGILRLDMLATETFPPRSYPTHLYYNPHLTNASFAVSYGTGTNDLLDIVSERFLKTNVTAPVTLTLPPDAAAVIVAIPAGAAVGTQGKRMYANGRIVNYQYSGLDGDGDGLADWWETRYYGNATNASPSGLARNGRTNLECYQLGVTPLDPQADLKLQITLPGADHPQLTWGTVGGKTYNVCLETNLAGGTGFSSVHTVTETNAAVGMPGLQTYVDSSSVLVSGASNRFYRVQLRQ